MSDYPRDQRNRGNGDNSGIPWPLIIIAFCIFWPVGILLLLLKFSQDAKLQQHKEDWVNALNNQDIPFAQRQETAAQRQAERQAAQSKCRPHDAVDFCRFQERIDAGGCGCPEKVCCAE